MSRLAVTGALTLTDDGWQVREPKTPRSRRPVLLTVAGTAALRGHPAAQSRERLQLAPVGRVWTWCSQTGWLARCRRATCCSASSTHCWRRRGLPRIRFYDLRHSAATLLLGQGVHAKVVSDLLGHTQTGVTLDVYSHVSPSMHADAVRAPRRTPWLSDRLSGGAVRERNRR